MNSNQGRRQNRVHSVLGHCRFLRSNFETRNFWKRVFQKLQIFGLYTNLTLYFQCPCAGPAKWCWLQMSWNRYSNINELISKCWLTYQDDEYWFSNAIMSERMFLYWTDTNKQVLIIPGSEHLILSTYSRWSLLRRCSQFTFTMHSVSTHRVKHI